MSHKHSEARELARQVSQAIAVSPDAEQSYGIVISPDGRVKDVLDNLYYDSIDDWAAAQCGEPGDRVIRHHHWDE